MRARKTIDKDGFANAKILILKQITTEWKFRNQTFQMVLLMQRY